MQLVVDRCQTNAPAQVVAAVHIDGHKVVVPGHVFQSMASVVYHCIYSFCQYALELPDGRNHLPEGQVDVDKSTEAMFLEGMCNLEE